MMVVVMMKMMIMFKILQVFHCLFSAIDWGMNGLLLCMSIRINNPMWYNYYEIVINNCHFPINNFDLSHNLNSEVTHFPQLSLTHLPHYYLSNSQKPSKQFQRFGSIRKNNTNSHFLMNGKFRNYRDLITFSSNLLDLAGSYKCDFPDRSQLTTEFPFTRLSPSQTQIQVGPNSYHENYHCLPV